MKIILTGGIGCGKSTAITFLKQMLPDYYFFDFDETVHQLYKNPLIQKELLSCFHTFERKSISNIVYQDKKAMQQLIAIFDPFILKEIQIQKQFKKIVFDIPLYFEYQRTLNINPDYIICISSSYENQLLRVKKRNNFSEKKIKDILAHQLPLQTKEKLSNFVIYNNDTKEVLRNTVEKVIQQINNISKFTI